MSEYPGIPGDWWRTYQTEASVRPQLRTVEIINFRAQRRSCSVGLTAEPKTLLTFPPKLRVTGSLSKPHVSVDKASAAKRVATALSALVVGPLGLLVPFVSLGAAEKHPCDDTAGQQTTD